MGRRFDLDLRFVGKWMQWIPLPSLKAAGAFDMRYYFDGRLHGGKVSAARPTPTALASLNGDHLHLREPPSNYKRLVAERWATQFLSRLVGLEVEFVWVLGGKFSKGCGKMGVADEMVCFTARWGD